MYKFVKKIAVKTNDFRIKFGMDSHEIELETLVNSLMFTSNIIQEVNRELESSNKIEVKIKALEKGSFEVHVELVETVIENLFNKNIVEYGSAIVSVVGGIYGLAKFLMGKKPKDVKEQPNKKVKITNENGDVTIIEGNVFNIYNQNSVIRDNVSKQFILLEKNEEIDNFQFIDSSNNTIIIDDSEFEDLSKKIETETKQTETEILNNEKLQIIRPSFVKDLKWDFVYKNTKISAKMDDEELIKIIDNGEQFSKGDLMVVELEIIKFYDEEISAFLITKDSYKIKKFIQHIKNPSSGRLF